MVFHFGGCTVTEEQDANMMFVLCTLNDLPERQIIDAAVRRKRMKKSRR
jgi:hypothetical protein